MQAAKKIKPPATVTKLPTAAKRPVRQPTKAIARKLPKWGDKLAARMADRLPSHRPWLVGTTIEPHDFDELTWIGIHGWRGDNRSAWDKHVLAADRMLRERGLIFVGAATRLHEHGTLACVFVYRGGNEHDRAIVGEYLRRAREATSKGQPYLRVVT